MTNTKKKKSARDKRVLIASIICAGLIVAGSTFAWFTSQDEVTNRLSASANYNVTIAEDFQPPEEWIPGQTINKDVSAVNTGNVDAFVRMWLEGEMSVFNRTNQNDSVAMPGDTTTALTATTDQKYIDLGFTYVDGDKNYYKELSQLKRDNPSNNASGTFSEETNVPAQFSEVQAMQAGGYLAFVPTSAANYHFTVEQATTIEAYATTDATTKTVINLKKGDVVATKGSSYSGAAAYLDNGTSGIAIDTSEFVPETEGVYLFRRNVDLNSEANAADDYEYSGYYYVPKSGTLIADADADHYLALYTDTVADDSDRSNYTVPNNAVTAGTPTEPGKDILTVSPTANLKFYNAKETVVENGSLTWTYTAASESAPAKLTAKYAGADDAATDDISIDINLANTGNGAENWTVLGEGAKTTFYYNNDVEAGDTTTKLVDSVKLADATSQNAFLAFDFDLNVNLESIQVTETDAGVESGDSVKPWAFAARTGATGTVANTDQEISSITWAKNG